MQTAQDADGSPPQVSAHCRAPARKPPGGCRPTGRRAAMKPRSNLDGRQGRRTGRAPETRDGPAGCASLVRGCWFGHGYWFAVVPAGASSRTECARDCMPRRSPSSPSPAWRDQMRSMTRRHMARATPQQRHWPLMLAGGAPVPAASGWSLQAAFASTSSSNRPYLAMAASRRYGM